MKVPLSWLADFVELALPPDELAERMTFAGLEVTAIERIGDFWGRDTVLVGRIVQVEPHPNADRLTLPTVEYGDGRTIRLVTGAPNIKVGMVGQKVPVALVGARLIDGHSADGGFIVLKPAKLRGVESSGMVCSERELGLSEEHAGILILPDDAPLGMPLADYLGDTILEVEPTPDRSRCLSILGVAREVAALTGRKVTYHPAAHPAGHHKASDLMEIVIDAPDLSARYCGTWIGGGSIGPSPFRMQRRLSLSGVRPISNVVDATNYVMLELGQPLHAFDYAALRDRAGGGKPRIVVRTATEGEKIVTLDGTERVCAADTLLITDSKGPIALAGVMGGRDTEVTGSTAEILLEAANFRHDSIRRTAQRFKLPSQASLRFGKGLPASLALEASNRATRLIAELTGGEMAEGTVDTYPRKQEPVTVFIGHDEFERILGSHVSEQRVRDILEALEFGVTERENVLTVDVPEHRLDVTIAADLVEEVARMEGYDTIPATLMREYLPPQERNPLLEAEDEAKDRLAGFGLEEVINYGLVDERRAMAWNALWEPGFIKERGDFIRVRNPLSEDRTVMRVSLVPELLENLRNNRRFLRRVAVFETGRVFHPRASAVRPDEPRRLGILLWGNREEPWWGKPLTEGMDFFDLKGVVCGLLARFGVKEPRLEPSSRECLQPGRGVEVWLGDARLGFLGELSTRSRREFDLDEDRVAVAELDLEMLAGLPRVPVFAAPGRFPAVVQDMALVVDEDLPAAALEKEIRAAAGDLLTDVAIFDVYRGPQVPEGKKSIAWSLSFQAPDRTLTEEEATRLREKIIAALGKTLNATLR